MHIKRCCCCSLEKGVLSLLILTSILLGLYSLLGVIASIGQLPFLRLLKLLRVLPGTFIDALARTIALSVMYCCYRNSKTARLTAFIVWTICAACLFLYCIVAIISAGKDHKQLMLQTDDDIATAQEEGELEQEALLRDEKLETIQNFDMARKV